MNTAVLALIGFGLLVLWATVRLLLKASAAQRRQAFSIILALIVGGIGLVLVARGRLDFAFMLLGLFYPFVQGWLARRAGGGAAAGTGKMDAAEARAVLGVDENASAEDIHAAYKKLMRAVHPDVGGTDGLAARLNEARDVLLGKRG